MYEIQPINITFGANTIVLKKIAMVVTYQLDMEQMMVPYNLLDENNVTYWSGTAMISSEELANWGTNNMYIVNLVAQKAGVTLI